MPRSFHPRRASRYDIFVSERELALEGQKFHEEYMPLNQMIGLPMDLAVYGSGTGPQPFVTAKDYDRFLKRVREFPRWADGAIAHDARGHGAAASRCRAWPWPRWCRNCAKSARRTLKDNIFWAPIAAMPKEISAKDRQRISDAYAAALTKEVLPAYTRLADFIERDYLPAARTTVGWSGSARRPGLVSLAHPPGATTMDMPAEEIHRLGLAEVARIRGEMLSVKNQVGFKGDLDAFFKYPRGRPEVLLHERRRIARTPIAT